MPEDAVRAVLADIEMEVHPFDLETAYRAGALRKQTRRLGLSFGDRACLAFGERLGWPVLTTDRDWKELDVGVEVRVVR